MKAIDRLIVALDFDTQDKALEFVKKLKGEVRFFKVGFELFSSCGPVIVEKIRALGFDVFLDLKYHDIPNTVAKAAVSVTGLGAYMFNVHALGGFDMMKKTVIDAALESKRLGIRKPKIIAVTVLTSMDEAALSSVGIDESVKNEVLKLALLAKEAGLDGVVASPLEAKMIREACGEEFLIVTPGVRPQGATANDQKRVATPKSAIEDGANYIVVGRPITEAKDPVQAARGILEEMK
jgi:orotidine-5'-phosphate decarboxylase